MTLVVGSLRDLHEGMAWVMVIGNGMAGFWALAAHRVGALRGRALWWFTALVQVAIAVQVTMGVGLVAGLGIALLAIMLDRASKAALARVDMSRQSR